MSAAAFWAPFEKTASSFEEVTNIINGVFLDWAKEGRQFAWRGHVDADWPLHSSLYRRLQWIKGVVPDEEALYKAEDETLIRFHRWGLHRTAIGRLSILVQLALMQHYGAPTRLIDVTFNPFVGLWFAAEEKWENGVKKFEDRDGRLFAIDVTDRLINENDKRNWEEDCQRPWHNWRETDDDWRRAVWAWRPPRFEDRISAQNGGFLLGGVPATRVAGMTFQLPKTTRPSDGKWRIKEARAFTSVALRPHKLDPEAGVQPSSPVYTIRIASEAKEEIRQRLQSLHGYRHSTIYPDMPGFASFAVPQLRSWKP